MDWIIPFRQGADTASSEPRLSRRLLRRLVESGRITVGSRVLDAGCGRGELTRFLAALSIQVAGIDDSPDQIATAQAAAGHLDYTCCRASTTIPLREHSFDVVLARNLAEHRGDLLSGAALRATAHLLATVRPGGRLVLVGRIESQSSKHPGLHESTCYQQHLAAFPGTWATEYLTDSLSELETWRRLLGWQPLGGFMVAALTVPDEARSVCEWEEIARRAAQFRRHTCCLWAQAQTETASPSRIAA
jgi:SAM-dependent methyltransferase